MALLPELPAHLSAIQSLLDDCTEHDLSLINVYIVERAKQQQADSRAAHMARFKPGDRVCFEDKHGEPVEAIVIKPNKKTVTLLSYAGTKWNVSPELLEKVESPDTSRQEPTPLSLVQSDKSGSASISSIGRKREWIGGLIDAPRFITDEPGAPYRPQMFMWLNDIGQVIRIELMGPENLELDLPQELEMAINEPAIGPAGAPSHIRMSDARHIEILKASFPSIHFECAPTPELARLQSIMQKDMALSKPMTYSATGAGAEAIGEFFDAAALLYRAKPWSLIPHDQSLISVSIEAMGVKHAALSVIGQMGQHFGILLFDQLVQYERYMLMDDALSRGVEPDSPPHTFLSFDPAKEIEADIRKDISSHGWKVANTKAYPVLMAPAEGRTMRPITPRDITLFNTLARSLVYALSNKDFIASHTGASPTRIEQTLQTDSGPMTIVLEAPFPYEQVMHENGASDSLFARLITMERTSDEMDWELHDALSTELQDKYQASPEAKAIDVAASVSTLIMSFSFNYLDCTVATLRPVDLEQILYEIIPQKVMMPASEAINMIDDARAFFSFLKRAYQSEHADRCLSILTDDAATRMAAAMKNPNLFGMGKSALSEGTGFPFDLPDFPPELPGPSATKPKPVDSKTKKKQRAATKKSRKKNR
ncbi:hypothetical protein [Granulosicoccus antarcticus]|uniref:Uncharacterized protein n=1 Tax=Granulosicoccus antarcticus IMCC3135 TaxID=1192854 RepID=A0A2Z2NYI3_9GAMM|nr:hypothetical protein [Granulosicoccus antarcticus]ASJ72827.1 hypothetical protein IMCC3135_13710 [Granulosicoccus antarcticus IMCC3135]